jgi:hypothetical protein
MRANEKFSGRGHAQHLCKECARLGKDELAYRQAVRNLDRLMACSSTIPRRKREQFRQYLEHKNERVRAYARQIAAVDAAERAQQRLCREMDDLAEELMIEEEFLSPAKECLPGFRPTDAPDIPF